MAITFGFDGPVLIEFGDAMAVQDLGYARDGVQIRIEPRMDDIMNDTTGGDRGVPAEKQFLGAIAYVTADINEFDSAYMDLLHSYYETASTAGEMAAMGTLLHQGTEYGTLALTGDNRITTFTRAFITGVQEWNASMRHKSYRVQWECWQDAWLTSATNTLFAFS